jgi:hydrogenase expression/formation protein HypE
MAAREGLQFETTIESDCAPLSKIVLDMIEHGVQIHCLRDLTRGGLVSALGEIVGVSPFSILLDEKSILVEDQVRGACEMLGLDPLSVANEGRMVLILPESEAQKALNILERHKDSSLSRVVGSVNTKNPGLVLIKNSFGITRHLDMLSGEQLPRIC